ncbi:signal peptide-containing protein [Babesia caballi]|uniref:Signal peptide-containing protein n=1 Tax=Babesia caballi TaxID=5871 RepID=A0AAV4LT17_BABCB|nr:signal peptide-containing protein [Babesia caballi]
MKFTVFSAAAAFILPLLMSVKLGLVSAKRETRARAFQNANDVVLDLDGTFPRAQLKRRGWAFGAAGRQAVIAPKPRFRLVRVTFGANQVYNVDEDNQVGIKRVLVTTSDNNWLVGITVGSKQMFFVKQGNSWDRITTKEYVYRLTGFGTSLHIDIARKQGGEGYNVGEKLFNGRKVRVYQPALDERTVKITDRGNDIWEQSNRSEYANFVETFKFNDGRFVKVVVEGPTYSKTEYFVNRGRGYMPIPESYYERSLGPTNPNERVDRKDVYDMLNSGDDGMAPDDF